MTPTADHGAPESVLTRKLDLFLSVEEAHVRFLRQLLERRERMPRHTELVAIGDEVRHVYVVISGWAMRYKLLPDGRRQVLSFALPGDFVCLDACILKHAEYAASLLTNAEVAVIEVTQMIEMASEFPELNAIVLWSTGREESTFMERLVSLGRRSAYERTAHVLLELYRRQRVIGLADEDSFAFPVSQAIMGDLLGLSTVHVNRTYRRLMQNGLISVHVGGRPTIEIHDLDALYDVADFDEGYLHPRETRLSLWRNFSSAADD